MIDLTGQKFGRLTVIRRSYPNSKNHKAMWLCKCDCGTEKIIRGDSIIRGKTKSCGCWNKEYIRTNELKPGIANMKKLIRSYKKGAEKRGLNYELTEKQFAEITQKDCYYCGSKPNNTYQIKGSKQGFTYNGLDRIDNDRGYTIDNVMPCCKHCNYAKSNMNLQEFKDWVKKIYNKMFNIIF